MLCGACWMPRSSRIETLAAPRDALARRRARRPRRRPRARSSRRRASRASASSTASAPARALGQERAIHAARLDQRREQRGQAEGVRAGPHLEEEVGQLRGLGAARVDHDQRARRVLRDLAQHGARAREAVRLPRVLADEHRHLGVLEVGRGVAARRAEELAVHPELAGLLLRQRVRGVDRCRAPRAWRARTRRAGGCPGRRRRSRGWTRRRSVSRTRAKPAATSRIAVSQSTGSKLPSRRRRSGDASRCRPFW